MPRTIRILLLGDEDVGKSAFISSIIKQRLAKFQSCFSPVLLPADMCQGSRDVLTQLIDTNPRKPETLEDEIRRTQLILLFYDISAQDTVARLTSYWMPLISKINSRLPIIIVGNKLDKKEDPHSRPGTNYSTIKEVLKPIIRKYKQVEMGLECSSLSNKGVLSVLTCAQRAILYPLGPLYDLTTKDITPNFKRVLTRIFRVLDKDGDGYLSDTEFLALQNRVFDSSLQSDDMKKIKEVIKVELERDEMAFVSLEGFFTLNKKCIEMLSIHICWSILRHFGYNDQMKLIPATDRFAGYQEESGSSIELKERSINFLKTIYRSCSRGHEKDKTSQKLIQQIFYPANNDIPIDEFIRVKEQIELSDFILAWQFLAYSNYLQCYNGLRSIGYEGDLDQTFLLRREKISLRDMSYIQLRNVISVGVIDSGGYEAKYVQELFAKSHDEYGLKRSHYIYSQETGSKVVYIFRLTVSNMERFFYHKSRMLDVVVFFEPTKPDSRAHQALEMVPEWTMVRKVNQKEANTLLGIKNAETIDMDKSNLTKKYDYRKLFDMVWQVLRNPELGYSPDTTARLRMLNEKTLFEPRNIAVMSMFLAALSLFGYLIIRRRNIVALHST